MSRLNVHKGMTMLNENNVVGKFQGKEGADIGKKAGIKKKALADVANTINQKNVEKETPKKTGIHLPSKKRYHSIFKVHENDKSEVTKPNKNEKLLQPSKNKLSIKVSPSIKVQPSFEKDCNVKQNAEEKPVSTAVYVDGLVDGNETEEFGCNHCLEPFEDDYEDILPKCVRLTAEQIIYSAMCWDPKPKAEKIIFNLPLLPEPEFHDTEYNMFKMDDCLLTV